ncbi:hypothetical protein C8A01DRAFT_40703 [Parachaetomium inaequale]|uniref:Uncharacterized protein n=1 Tax=Parachaetomium inaequale TaxID=2588326 RepID=A0AAN6P6W8_9PEZI|nr:hypothetical protein C8A01DRAFT_40703 [Parachaetomium inaequale]
MRYFASIRQPRWGHNRHRVETSSCGRGPWARAPEATTRPLHHWRHPASTWGQAGRPRRQTAQATAPDCQHISHPSARQQQQQPSGSLQYKTLAKLCSELPFDGAATQGLTISVDSAYMATVEHIPPNDEDRFEWLRQHINTEIQSWFRRQRRNGNSLPSLWFDICIKRTCKGEEGEGRVEDLKLELDW